MTILQLAQSRDLSDHASAVFQLLLRQNEALQERVASLEKSRPASVISAHTVLEGAEDNGNPVAVNQLSSLKF